MNREPLPVVVLVVEDEWLLREILAGEMRRAGWQVLESSTGEAALMLHQKVDVLITDIHLAGELSGWDIADGLRARAADLPVVYVSGKPSDGSRMVPGSTFLQKPCDPNDVLNACRALLQVSLRRREEGTL